MRIVKDRRGSRGLGGGLWQLQALLPAGGALKVLIWVYYPRFTDIRSEVTRHDLIRPGLHSFFAPASDMTSVAHKRLSALSSLVYSRRIVVIPVPFWSSPRIFYRVNLSALRVAFQLLE